MGKTYKRNQQYRPKKHGKVFTKDRNPWKKDKYDDINRDVRTKEPQNYDLGTE